MTQRWKYKVHAWPHLEKDTANMTADEEGDQREAMEDNLNEQWSEWELVAVVPGNRFNFAVLKQ